MMHKITLSLKEVYNKNASHYARTRHKYRKEGDMIIGSLHKYKGKKIKILDLGCGDGRFYRYLSDNYDGDFSYTGLDVSDELVKIADERYDAKFVCEDMMQYIKSPKQESFDIVVMIASFQHLPDIKYRLFLLKNVYRILKYDGLLIMTNWSFSDWFIKKYFFNIIISLWKYLISLGKNSWKDVYIAWNHNGDRYYHIFSQKELFGLARGAGFAVSDFFYSDNRGKKTKNWRESSNSIAVFYKKIVNNN